MIASLLVGSALLLLFSPWVIAQAVRLFPAPGVAASPAGVSYQAAISDLASVRKRLSATQQLDDKSKAAIDTLTLALVAGSDQ